VAGSPHPHLLYHLSYSYYTSRLRYMSLVWPYSYGRSRGT
jgi:hypothetical protein